LTGAEGRVPAVPVPDVVLRGATAKTMSSARVRAPGYLFVLPWSLEWIGGVNEVVRRLYDELAQRGDYRPVVLELGWNDRPRHSADPEPRRTSWMRLQSVPLDGPAMSKEKLVARLRRPGACLRLRRFLRDENVQVVNLHYPGLLLEHFAALRRFHLRDFKLIASFHGSDVDASVRSEYHRFRMSRALAQADAVVVPSEALARRISAVFPSTRVRIHRIYNGIDVEGFLSEAREARARRPDTSHGAPYVLHVGNFETVKAHDVLLEAWARVAAARPDVRLVAVGRTGPTLDYALARVARPDLAGRVEIRTDVAHADVAALMRDAAAVVLPSRLETFPLVLLEAGAMGRAVVASAVGGIPELITHGEAGLLVPPENAPELASALLRVLSAPDFARSLGASLESRVRAHFTWDRAATEYERVISSVG
jgi:glycosyltransferase involved in cell wall biosynthesis